ncbi:MAG TPA: TauD/TfdA family dioxygenase [Xanthobacteraceae bacterium]|nr:TauD/TfdA family dioxygenase [Xanthobacteraceae bacterium]
MSFTVNALSTTGAAEIVDLDCSAPLDPDTLAALQRAMLDYPVVAIREQNLTPRRQAAFSRQLGPLEAQDRKTYCDPDDPDVLILSNEIRPDGSAVGIVDAGDFWHSDSSHLEEPCRATVLYAVRNPKSGGDTEFCNMHQVYDALPDDLRRRIEGRDGLHHISKAKNPRATISKARADAAAYYKEREQATRAVRQPMVRTHPQTGRQALYVSPRFTIGIADMPDAEAQPLLDALFALMREPRFHYRHRWRDGDLVVWDNRCLNHQACGGYSLPDIRRMHRTTIRGDKPFYRPAA